MGPTAAVPAAAATGGLARPEAQEKCRRARGEDMRATTSTRRATHKRTQGNTPHGDTQFSFVRPYRLLFRPLVLVLTFPLPPLLPAFSAQFAMPPKSTTTAEKAPVEEKPVATTEEASVEVEEAAAEESGSDDEMPDLEEAEGADADATVNRSEKKARKAILKLGLKGVQGITRVTVKKAKNILFVIAKPDVYKSPVSDTYVIFGEAKIEDINAQAQAAAASQFTPEEAAKAMAAVSGGADAAAPAEAAAEADDGEAADETGLDPDEINTIMQQANCSRAKAVKALRKHSNIVDAILELTP